MSALSSAFRGIASAFGVGGGPSTPSLPGTPRSLDRLSLSELTSLGTKTSRQRQGLEARFAAGNQRRTTPAGFSSRRGQTQSRATGALEKRETEIAGARRRLIRQGTAQRARRATTITTLLGRGR